MIIISMFQCIPKKMKNIVYDYHFNVSVSMKNILFHYDLNVSMYPSKNEKILIIIIILMFQCIPQKMKNIRPNNL